MVKHFWMCLLAAVCISCGTDTLKTPLKLASPGGGVLVEFGLDGDGLPWYQLSFNGKPVVDKSALGLDIEGKNFKDGFTLTGFDTSSHRGSWKPPYGEYAEIQENYNQLSVHLQHAQGHKLTVHFKAFDDGIGFRYEVPQQPGLDTLVVLGEGTQFQMTGDHKVWWIPGDWDSNEHIYTTSKISEIDATPYNEVETPIHTQHIVDVHSVQTPLVMQMEDGTHLLIHEAALWDYPAMYLHVDRENRRFEAQLIPSAKPPVKSVNATPFKSPWRVILTAPDAAGIISSNLVLNLNDPNAIGDVSWIKPMKYVGIWWEMHVGISTWDMYGSQDMSSATNRTPSGKHGATTENAKRYIDFAAKHGFDGVLVEGWNIGWEDWFGKWIDSVFSFTTPYPDYDIDFLSKYAAEKGVKLIMHHETSSAVPNYESQMEAAFKFMKDHGIDAVKTGYVGKIIPRGEFHDGQWMINHYRRVAETAAKYKITVNSHESVRSFGQSRTYPNWWTAEAARGNEFNAWSVGNPPEHETILPFTRLKGGGMDYTPGIFEVRMSTYDPNKSEVVHTTVAKQLALYVTMYSPLQMAADLPQNYEKRLDVFQFIKDVPVDWQDTRVLHAAVGDHLGLARKDKHSNNWWIGSITDEEARSFELVLDFLDDGKSYLATIYEDGPGAHWKDNPYPVNIRKQTVKKGDIIQVNLAAGGGTAIGIVEQ
ncbi:MAG: alpha-glucosidase [Saprospiraceae bacterium]|nr:MAG: alpha-glucosidase [Saprospiraceae bacterium]